MIFLALCRVDLLFEQIHRIDPKSLTQTRSIPHPTSFSARSLDAHLPPPTTNANSNLTRQPVRSPSVNSFKQPLYGEPISNGKVPGQAPYPVPVLRTQPPPTSNRSSAASNQERTTFKPIEQQQSSILSNTTPRPTPIHPQTSPYSFTEKTHFV